MTGLGMMMMAWAEVRNWAELGILAVLVQPGKVDTAPPGRTEVVQGL